MTTTSTDARQMIRDLAVDLSHTIDDPDKDHDQILDGLLVVLSRWRDMLSTEDGLDPIEALWLFEAESDRLRRSLGVIRGAIDRLMLVDIQQRGDVRLGEFGYRDASGRERKIIDRDQLVEWVGPEHLADVWRLDDGNLRTSALEALAERRAREQWPDDDEAAAELATVIVDTFLAWNDPAPGTPARKLDRVPVSRAKWAAKLAHGERRPR